MRRRDGTLVFGDHPEFRPNLTPREIFAQGAFGGTYWRPIHSAVTGKNYRDVYKKYKSLKGLSPDLLCRTQCDVRINKYGVASGTSLQYWEEHNWITAGDPYGWVQWYCEFYEGRRGDDDERQIGRWLKFAGPNGRFLRRLAGLVSKQKGTTSQNLKNYDISPVIRQGLHQWGKVLTASDVRAYAAAV